MDIHTLLICSAALLGFGAGVLLILRARQRETAGLGWLSAGFAAAMLGLVLGAARGQIADLWSIVVGNSLVMVGYLLLHQAVAGLVGAGRRHVRLGLVLLTAFVLSAAYFTYVVNDAQPRIATFSLILTIQAGLSALLLRRSEGGSDLHGPARALGMVLVALAALNLLRALLSIWTGTPADFTQSGAVQAALLLCFIIAAAAVGICFVWLASAGLHASLRDQATRDPLTGLLNRRGFMDAARARRRTAEREGSSLLLIFADLDGLKAVNDSAGHEAGDSVLRDAAELLRRALQGSDAIARLGGDEFCALLTVGSAADGEELLARIQRQVVERDEDPRSLHSFGISAAAILVEPQEADSLEELLRTVDDLMYVTKRARKQGGAPGLVSRSATEPG